MHRPAPVLNDTQSPSLVAFYGEAELNLVPKLDLPPGRKTRLVRLVRNRSQSARSRRLSTQFADRS